GGELGFGVVAGGGKPLVLIGPVLGEHFKLLGHLGLDGFTPLGQLGLDGFALLAQLALLPGLLVGDGGALSVQRRQLRRQLLLLRFEGLLTLAAGAPARIQAGGLFGELFARRSEPLVFSV